MTRFPRALSEYAAATRPDGEGIPRRRVRDVRRPLLLVATLVVSVLAWPRDPTLSDRFEGTGTRTVAHGLVATWSGVGAVTGTGHAPAFAWSSGSVDLDVEHGAGIALVVRTDEAEVRVVGTRFRVARSAYGSDVAVTRGKVSVHCADGTERFVEAGESIRCVPVVAAALLQRARALQADGDPSAALAAIDGGLRDPGLTAVVQDELLALRVALLMEAGRFDEAVEAARGYLGRPSPPRADDVARLAADAAPDAATRCSYLARVSAPSAADRLALSACVEKSGTRNERADTRGQDGE